MVIKCACAAFPVTKPVPNGTGLKGRMLPVAMNTFETLGSVMDLKPEIVECRAV
jgi:hypothetical protein